MTSKPSSSLVAQPDALMESMVFEDGMAAAVEALEAGVPGLDAVTVQLALMKVLAVDVADRLAGEDPFTVAEDDRFFALPTTNREQRRPDAQPDEAAQWERAIVDAHTVLNQVSALRARGVAHLARWGRDDADAWTVRQHPLGHRSEDAGDELAPLLRLGTYEADRLVDESVWMVTRTPNLLHDAAVGAANLATVATIAAETQDARPETCERVEEAIRRRSLYRTASRVSARRSARTLVERFESAAARATAKRTTAQQTGVWLDPHPTPGLALLSAALPTADAEALMTAIEQRATRTHRDNGDGRLLGQHRADALTELALRNVTLTAHLDIVVGAENEAEPARSNEGRRRGAGEVLRDASIVLTPKVGAVPGERLAAVLAAHTGGRSGTVSVATVDAQSDADLGVTDSYRPPKALRDRVIRRDGHCRFPGCQRPARCADLDHVLPWPNGPTSATNLQCLCRRHHRAKQRGWSVSMDAIGTCTWTSPRGRCHATRPRLGVDLDDLDDLSPDDGDLSPGWAC